METNSTGGNIVADFLAESAYQAFLKVENSESIQWIRQKSAYLLPVFCMIGIGGNSMALILIRTNFWLKKLTSNIYLCALSLSSCLFLATLLVTFADAVYHLPLYRDSVIGCKIFTFLAHFSDFICVWMISWISCDRMIILYRPGIRKWVCTKKFARNLMLGTALLSCVLYSWVFLFAGLEKAYHGTRVVQFCGLNQGYKVFGYPVSEHYFFFTLMDTVVCTVLPSFVIIIVNTFSTFRYRQCMKIYSTGKVRVRFNNNDDEGQLCLHYHPDDNNSPKMLLLPPSQTKQPTTTTTTVTHTGTSTSSTQTRCGRLKSSDLQLSRTLLIVTSTFVLLNMPNYIMRIIQYLFNFESHLFHLVHYITFLMYYLHHAVLFYMYIFWSPQMKKQLGPTAVRLLECYCFKSVPEFGHRSVSGNR